ncbi:MAG: glycosyltransferase [Bacteroidia bacterium]|nr:glycosyltransferase [Bacteroidia bacterium]
MLLSAITVVISLIYGWLFVDYIIGWCQLKDHRMKKDVSELSTQISILISARNEEEHIENCLYHISKQDYPKHLFEIIVIDDHSTDRTIEIIELCKEKLNLNNLSIIKLDEMGGEIFGKKEAIKAGINSSKYDLILVTDADCIAGPKWVSTTIDYYEDAHPKLISGPVGCFEGNSLFEKMQCLEIMGLGGSGAAAMSIKRPNMCNGGNLAYLKETFREVEGFEGFESYSSGDDEFLMHKIAKKYPNDIHFLKSQDCIVDTYAKATLSGFLTQRKRWVSKSTKYKNVHSTVTAWIVLLFNMIFLLNLILSFSKGIYEAYVFQIAIKFILELIFLYLVTGFFKKQQLLKWFIPTQLCHIIYVVFIAFYGNIGGYKWKDRVHVSRTY